MFYVSFGMLSIEESDTIKERLIRITHHLPVSVSYKTQSFEELEKRSNYNQSTAPPPNHISLWIYIVLMQHVNYIVAFGLEI